ncbi:MAG: bifunctional riboflavin kinase/FAD synthetase [Deltaproteobacteria bacterium]
MKVIKSRAPLRGVNKTVVTLGNFDGIHTGHRLILKKVVARARALKCPSVVYTFEPHPLKVVDPGRSLELILDTEDKKALIKDAGIDWLVFARFTRSFASKHPKEFVEEVLAAGLKAREVWVGANFVFGKGRSGTVEHLKALGGEFGFRVFAIAPARSGREVVSSSRIRALIKDGFVEKASKLLKRDFSIKGIVVKGRGIGKALGFPTANLRIKTELVPKNGVYAAYAFVGRSRYNALVNIGMAPTFGKRPRTVEAHILGLKSNIYGKAVKLSFIKRLRDEKAFRDGAGLAGQIKKDIEKAKGLFGQL